MQSPVFSITLTVFKIGQFESEVSQICFQLDWRQTCLQVWGQDQWLQPSVGPHWRVNDRKRAVVKMFTRLNSQCPLSQYCVQLSFVLTAEAASMFATKREYLCCCFFFKSPNSLHNFTTLTTLHMIGHTAQTCTCDPSATSLPPIP